MGCYDDANRQTIFDATPGAAAIPAQVLAVEQRGARLLHRPVGPGPKNKSFGAAVFSNATLAVHALIGLLLLGAAISVLVRAVRARHRFMVWDGPIGLAAVIAAIGARARFVNRPDGGTSLGMGVHAAVALVCYLAGVFMLGGE